MDVNEALKQQILDLQDELSAKNADLERKDRELQRYQHEVGQLNKKIEVLIAKISEELNMATQLQRKLSPTELPHIGGFEFSSKFRFGSRFGGDYFDIFELPDKMKFVMILSSASSHGVSALLLTSLLKNSSLSVRDPQISAYKLFEKICSDVRPEMGASDQVSLMVAIVDRRSFEMEVVACGRLHAFLARSSEAIESLYEGSAAFSKEDSRTFNETDKNSFHFRRVLLQSKEKLVFTSTGIVHAQHKSGEEFGLKNLKEAIKASVRSSVHELRNEILYRLEKMIQQDPPLADQTVLVAEVKDRVIKLAKS